IGFILREFYSPVNPGQFNFWSQEKRHLRRYNGIPRKDFHLFLAECEWRFNISSPAKLLKILTRWAKLPA
ncbi:MAG: hypothetical protein ABF876_19660, partial [Acetobacter aceti]